jgi:hypothetical protein
LEEVSNKQSSNYQLACCLLELSVSHEGTDSMFPEMTVNFHQAAKHHIPEG